MDSEGKPLDPPEVIPTKGLALTDAVKKILGKPGTKVKLTVEREGEDKPLEFEIYARRRRGRDGPRLQAQGQRRLGLRDRPGEQDRLHPPDAVRPQQLPRPGPGHARAERAGGIKGFILDLRFNPGGLLDSRRRDLRPVHRRRPDRQHPRARQAARTRSPAERDGSLLDFPMVCLVNGGSASGSEIVSACSAGPRPGHHHRRAQLRQGQRAEHPATSTAARSS